MTNFNFTTTATLILVAFLTSCSSNSSQNNSTSNAALDTSTSNSYTYSSPSKSSTYSSSENSSSSTSGKDPYEVMHVVFEGSPEIEKIKPMFEAVMETYNFPKTDDNRLKIANMLVTLKQSSAVGVTEMDILKHIYQHGSDKITLPEQAGLSATLLETSK
jgi:hypothetical protein